MTPPEDAVFYAQIFDVSDSQLSCETSDPGSDIQGIELQDAQGNTLGWGNLVWDGVEVVDNEQYNLGIIDGAPADLNLDGCGDSFPGNVLSLGCFGWIAVEFLDDNGLPTPIETGHSIVTYEYGAQCVTGGASDEYSVALCDDPRVTNGDDSSCTNFLGTASGLSSLTVF
jgi:hypothetical protein